MRDAATRCPACGAALDRIDGLCPACVARTMMALLDGNSAEPEIPGYELGQRLGRGGMGEVFQARRLSDDSSVAVKLALPGAQQDSRLVERLTREATALARLDHPRVLRVLDSGFTHDGRFFLVTPMAGGGDLAQLLRAGPLPVRAALEVFRQVVGAVAEAHRAGILHRDIKPANILLDGQGGVWVADFSLARVAKPGAVGGVTVTAAGDVFGTPYYLAPEVRHGMSSVDARADVFSLGVLLHELLTGRVPIGQYQPASRAARVPQAVDELIAQCLAEDPADRPTDAAQLHERFEASLQPRLPAWAKAALTSSLLLAAVFAWQMNQPAPVTAALGKSPGPTNASPARLSPARATRAEPWTNSLGMKFVPVPGVSALFSVWETRRGDFAKFALEGPPPVANADAPWRTPPGPADDTHPVCKVDLPGARTFCEWLTRRERQVGWIGAADVYRLPTDEEWSRAAGLPAEPGVTPEARERAMARDRGYFAWGRAWPPPLTGVPANFSAAEVLAVGRKSALRHRDDWVYTAPVGTFPPNEFGLHDLSGNAAEWCDTRWDERSDAFVLRGGSWDQREPESLRLTTRERAMPVARLSGAGFRVVLEMGR